MGEAAREKSRQEMSDEINKMIAEIAQYKVQIEVFKQERDDAIQRSQEEISKLKEELETLHKEHAATLWEYCDSVKKEEHERALKQIERDQVKIANLISEIDCKRSEIMPDEPIKAADCLIHAKGVRRTNAIQRICGASRYENYTLYSVSDLREIAEHLLAYCNNNEREVGVDD